ncbi:hypothetical protein BJF79_34120 [Actinomadura sp. CNU-125]|uniref:hypothetical protein n=1 Tax=Actinomadura sp. CNU-125 TaxID=1904961 RepID=UPI000960B670|nr:hypothetical protein [Actinomadura sp. CNU-125]OLT33924.1 hypothetical protein BJF79_34120 [Actinomadura sp. CNU-125]
MGDDRTVRWGDVRYSVPAGHEGRKVWCRVHGDELVIVGPRDTTGDASGDTARDAVGLAELWRHKLSTPGRPRIVEAHYPDHPGGNGPRAPRPRPQSVAERDFLAIGPGAEAWLDKALGLAAIHGRFAESDLASICDRLARTGESTGPAHLADECHSAQPGTGSGPHGRGEHPL